MKKYYWFIDPCSGVAHLIKKGQTFPTPLNKSYIKTNLIEALQHLINDKGKCAGLLISGYKSGNEVVFRQIEGQIPMDINRTNWLHLYRTLRQKNET